MKTLPIHYTLAFMLLALHWAPGAGAQQLDLYTCLDSAATHMPLLRQQELLSEVLGNKIRTYNNAYLPALTLNGQASYQSAVPELPFSLPGSQGLDLPKTQYRAYLEVYQPLFDGGVSRAAKISETAQTEVSVKTLEVSLVEYKKQVAQLYFQLLLIGDQQKIISQTLSLLRGREKAVRDALAVGAAQQNDLLRIQSEILAQEQKLDDLESARESGMEVLGLLCGIDVANRVLAVPGIRGPADYSAVNNPELQLISTRQSGLMATEKMIRTQRLPRISAFAQAGFGAPNPYNFFEKDLSSYYIAGVRASWTLWDWGKTSRDRSNLNLNNTMLLEQQNQKKIEVESRITRLRREGENLHKALERNEQVLQLRSQIRENASVQVEQGVITSTDYLDEVLAEQVAGLNKSVNEISLYQNQIMLQLETGSLK